MKEQANKNFRDLYDNTSTERISSALLKAFLRLDLMLDGYWLAMKNLKEEDEEKHKEEIKEWEESIDGLKKIINCIRMSKGKIDIELLGKEREDYDFYEFKDEKALTFSESEGDKVPSTTPTTEDQSLYKVNVARDIVELLMRDFRQEWLTLPDGDERKEELRKNIDGAHLVSVALDNVAKTKPNYIRTEYDRHIKK